MNACFALQNIEFIDITNVKRVGFIIQTHSVVFSSILKTQLVHEFGPFCLRDNFTFYVRLLNKDAKYAALIPTKAENSHVCVRKNRIMDNNPVKSKSKDIIMLECDELTNRPLGSIKENGTLRTYIECL